MRLFVSIDFSETVCEQLCSLVPDLPDWKKMSSGQLHLTLLFLGDCTEQDADNIHKQLSGIQFVPFRIEISGAGVFPGWENAGIIWAGIRENSAIIRLQNEIRERLSGYTNPAGEHKFIPHITLARKKGRYGERLERGIVREYQTIPFEVHHFNLKRSILKPAGSRYFTLYSYKANQAGL